MSAVSQRARGAIWAAAATGCWGTATVMSKGALEDVSPKSLQILQLAASALFVWSVLIIRRSRLLPWKNNLKIGLLGWLEPGLAYFFSLAGLVYVQAGVAALIQATEAFMIIGISAVLLRHSVGFKIVLLGVLAFVGVVISSDIGVGGSLDDAALWGVLLVLLGTFCAALYVTLSSRLVMDFEPLYMVGMQQIFALALVVGLGFDAVSELGSLSLSPEMLLLIIGSGILQYSLAFWCYLLALRHISASTAGMFLNMIPVVALIEANVFLGETLRGWQWLGVVLVLGAVTLFAQHEKAG